MEHVILRCNHAFATWFASNFGYHMREANVNFIQVWWKMIQELDESGEAHVVEKIILACWSIWLSRNKAVFDGVEPQPFETLRMVKRLTEDYLCSYWVQRRSPLAIAGADSQQVTLWKRPSQGTIKINCDAAFYESLRMAGVAAIARNHMGIIVDAINVKMEAISSHMAEA